MESKLVITRYKQSIVSVLMNEDNQFIELNIDKENDSSLLNNIYIGKVKNIVKNINAAFIQFDESHIGYYALNERGTPIFTNKNNTKAICIGDELIVQVIKEPVQSKAPVLTSNIELSGMYIILTVNKPTISFSKKYTNMKEKSQIHQVLGKLVSKEYGFIVRTNANEATLEEIEREAEQLIDSWQELKNKASYRTCYTLLKQTPKSYLAMIRDMRHQELNRIITDDLTIYEEIKEYYQDNNKIEFYHDELLPLLKLYSIEKCIEEASKERIWLKSGAYIVIQPTEALVVVDVNSGKNSTNKSVSKQMLKINLEAAKEIAHQIRLRNLSGIILIDFINMEEEKDKNYLMSEFDKVLKADRIKTTLVDMTKLDLVEVTRKKIKKPIYEQLKDLR